MFQLLPLALKEKQCTDKQIAQEAISELLPFEQTGLI